tara:strand:+ start:49 stop:459 length:411 start_codon:yes stop_codon:yes gene_type:complete
MSHWWLYLLIFVFGYFTCKTFYFVRSARVSLVLIKANNIIYLSSIIKAIEHLSYAREIMLEQMLKAGKNSTQISTFEFQFEKDVKLLKRRSVSTLLACHPAFFRSQVEFEDWEGAMKYLQENKTTALKFWETRDDW